MPSKKHVSELCRLYPELHDAIFKQGRNALITGPGGTGKSYSIGMIKAEADKMGRKCDLTSTTGVSAHAIGGSTIHRFSSIQLGDKPANVLIDKIRKNKDKLKRWKEADILIIDEVSMLGAQTLTLLDTIAKEIRLGKREMKLRRDKKIEVPPFGGIQVIMSADFLQLPPIGDNYAFDSPAWKNLNLFYFKMTHPYRYPDMDHFHRLMRIRTGEHTPEDITALRSRVTAYSEYKKLEREGKLVEEVRPTRIYPLRRDVDIINTEELEKLPGDTVSYEADDIITIKTNDKGKPVVNPDLLNTMDYVDYMDGIVAADVHLKEGAQVMLTKNMSVEDGLVNGSRGVVLECDDDIVRVKFRNGLEVDIAPYAYEYEDDKVMCFRHQFPLILAYASSVHKQQGATLDYAILDLGTSLFGPAMGYVELSRCKSMDGILIVNFMPEKVRADPVALNFERTIIDNNCVYARRLDGDVVEDDDAESVAAPEEEEKCDDDAKDYDEPVPPSV